MATMDDIAKRLGVSKGTVSKAFSGAGDVSEAMRRAVLETAVELGYTRALRSCQPTRLCVFIANMSYEHPNDFGWDLVTGFRKLAEPDGCLVELVPLTQELQRQQHYDEYMLLHQFQGAFFLGLLLRPLDGGIPHLPHPRRAAGQPSPVQQRGLPGGHRQ